MTIKIKLREVIYALADALDLVGIDEVEHGKRVGYMAVECAKQIGLEQGELDTLFHAALLHDCGVSSSNSLQHLIQDIDWKNVDEHCRRGSELLQGVEPLSHLTPVIRHHHTHWDRLQQTHYITANTAQLSNLIFLMDRVDAIAVAHYGKDILAKKDTIQNIICKYKGTLFAPELIDLFMSVSAKEAFWITLETRHLYRYLREKEVTQDTITIDFQELKQIAGIFANIVDAKSSYTHEHSLGVAQLARLLAYKCHLPFAVCEKVEVAGLLHDLGKLQVPDAILEKPGKLTPEERTVISRHSFETYQILKKITGLEEIAEWAGFHHETPGGHGYPFQLRDKELCLEARIIGVADVFQALAQKRPYREPLSIQDILKILREFAKEGRLDGNLVNLVAENLEECWYAARCYDR
ncbi:putative domain HDIG-containing protein [Beggiatoa alba B18LD]|uniref:Putative domain HDIG-containing protein n=1 Tax=Beggiatoa alba B18LD TaxID=395493 RepID=I3CH90_9GAMM|nr:HD domain-containing phosphohydrolase [Beggiatoa alba]EIJ42983.1 putative domain HDIG-containing protein [Beggiatoa alba B18LD]